MAASVQTDNQSLFSKQFIIMWIANFCFLTSQSCFFLFPLFIIDHNGNQADIGILMAALPLSSILLRPWISEMIDQVGRRLSYIIGSAIMGILPFVYMLFQGSIDDIYLPLFIIRLIHGIGVALGFTASITYIADITPPQRLNQGLGIFGVAALVGLAAGPTIAEPVIQALGFDAFFMTAAGFGLVSMLLTFFVAESLVSTTRHAESISFFTVLKRKKVLWGAVLSIFMGIGGGVQGAFVSPYGRYLGLTGVSFYFIAYSIAAVLVRVFGSKLTDRHGEEKIIPWAFIIMGTGFLILVGVTNIWMLTLAGFVTGVGHGFLFPCLNTLMIRGEMVEIRGKISGAFSGGMDSGMFLGTFTMGFVGEWLGYRLIFILTFIALILAPILFFTFARRAQSIQDQASPTSG